MISKNGETDSSLSFLDVALRRTESNSTVTITFRKRTAADCIIRNTSCHSASQKLASIRCFCKKIHICPLEDEEKGREAHTIGQIVGNNRWNRNVKKCWGYPVQERKDEEDQTGSKQRWVGLKKWATFTCYGIDVNHIRKLFKNTKVRIVYKTYEKYRVIEKDGRDLVTAPLLGLSISMYLNSTCFHKLKPSNKKL